MRFSLAATLTLLALTWIMPVSVFGAGLVNINTADKTVLETLPGIGPTYAARIITYRTAEGPFPTKEAIENVKGIGPSTYEKLAPLITVGNVQGTSANTSTTTSTTTTPSDGTAQETIAVPVTLQVQASIPDTFYVDEPTALSARATDAAGAFDTHARVYWNFGNGATTEGTQVTHTYRHAGTYQVVVTAVDGSAHVLREHTVTVVPSQVRVVSITGEGITLENMGPLEINLAGWRINSSKGIFRVPSGTMLLPRTQTLFPFTVLQLPIAYDAVLRFPDGAIASRYPHPAATSTAGVQPSPTSSGLQKEVTVEPIISSRSASRHVHENKPTLAPAAATNTVAAAGAALATPAGPTPAKHTSLITPWTLGLAGIITLAGAAFVFL